MAEGFDAAKLLERAHNVKHEHLRRDVVGDIYHSMMYFNEDGYKCYNYDDVKAMMEAGFVDTLVMMLTEWKFKDAREGSHVMNVVICIVNILTKMHFSWNRTSKQDFSFFTPSLLEAILPYIDSDGRAVTVLYTIFTCCEFPEHLRASVPTVAEALNSMIEKNPRYGKAHYAHATIDALEEQRGRRIKAARA